MFTLILSLLRGRSFALLPLLFLLTPAAVVGSGSVPGLAAPELVLLIPFEGQILPDNEQVKIMAFFDPPLDLSGNADVQVTIEAQRDGERIAIATGDLRSFSDPDRIEAVWDLSGLPVGPYRVRMVATAGDVRGEAEVTAHVHPAPKAELSLRYVKALDDGRVEAGFHVAAESPNHTPIPEYLWVPGDGSDPVLTDAADFSYIYPYAGAIFNVSVEVRDALGGSLQVGRNLNLPAELPPGIHLLPKHGAEGIVFVAEDYGYPFHPIPEPVIFQLPPICGCDEMAIEAMGRSRRYCLSIAAAGGRANAVRAIGAAGCAQVKAFAPGTCRPNEVVFDCPLGQMVPGSSLGWGFEVFSRLDVFTNDQNQCQQGQYARGTRMLNGGPLLNPLSAAKPAVPAALPGLTTTVTLPRFNGPNLAFPVVPNGGLIPGFAGPAFGSDDYAAPGPGIIKLHNPQGLFYWVDIPAVAVGRNDVSASQQDEFITFVSGNLSTCWCRFRIQHSWTRAGGAVPGGNITVIDGERCVAGPGVQRAPNAGKGVRKRF